MEKFYYDEEYRETQGLLTKLSWEKGEHDFLRKRETRICSRSRCGNNFITKPSNPKKYCSMSCAAIVNNTGRILSLETRTKIAGGKLKEKKFCMRCGSPLHKQDKYCSLKCQSDYNYYQYVEL